MRRALGAALTACALLAAAPAPSPSPAAPLRLTVVCRSTPFYLFGPVAPLGGIPQRAKTPPAQQGQTFEVLGDRTTLQSVEFVQTNVPNVEPGYPPDTRLWLWRGCVAF